MEGVSKCTKGSVRYLANLVKNDRRTLVGRTLAKIAEDCDTDRAALNTSIARKLKYRLPEAENEWKIPLLRELVNVRCGEKSIEGFEDNEVIAMIDVICTN